MDKHQQLLKIFDGMQYVIAKHVIDTLNRSNIKYAIVKGCPLAYYKTGRVDTRCSNDIDILIARNTMLPEVTTILYDRETMYENFSCFHLKENPDFVESAKRAITYRTESYRTKLRSNYENYDDYLSALGMQLDIHEVIPGEYGRVAELTQRTNKCTNGVRCTVTEIQRSLNLRSLTEYLQANTILTHCHDILLDFS